MSEILLLGGKVSKQSLPEVLPPSGPDGPALKRLMLPQGELAQLWDADEGMRYLAFIELKAGTVRGNHYHKNKEEWVYMMSGQVRLVVEEVDSKKREEVNIKKGDLVFIRTGVAHALQVLESGQAIEFSSARFDSADIFRLTEPLAS